MVLAKPVDKNDPRYQATQSARTSSGSATTAARSAQHSAPVAGGGGGLGTGGAAALAPALPFGLNLAQLAQLSQFGGLTLPGLGVGVGMPGFAGVPSMPLIDPYVAAMAASLGMLPGAAAAIPPLIPAAGVPSLKPLNEATTVSAAGPTSSAARARFRTQMDARATAAPYRPYGAPSQRDALLGTSRGAVDVQIRKANTFCVHRVHCTVVHCIVLCHITSHHYQHRSD